MIDQPFIKKCYENQYHQVYWTGLRFDDCEDFTALLRKDVAPRVDDFDGSVEFEACLRGLAVTGFEQENLRLLLEAEQMEGRDWAIGEALAEVHLSQEHGVTWPWNTARDKRTPYASLPGADLIGMMTDGEGVLFALGEVKCSSEAKCPPHVMSGRSGMAHQLHNLVGNLSLLNVLLKWLFPGPIQNFVYEAFSGLSISTFHQF